MTGNAWLHSTDKESWEGHGRPFTLVDKEYKKLGPIMGATVIW
jgi:hypothetical protein